MRGRDTCATDNSGAAHAPSIGSTLDRDASSGTGRAPSRPLRAHAAAQQHGAEAEGWRGPGTLQGLDCLRGPVEGGPWQGQEGALGDLDQDLDLDIDLDLDLDLDGPRGLRADEEEAEWRARCEVVEGQAEQARREKRRRRSEAEIAQRAQARPRQPCSRFCTTSHCCCIPQGGGPHMACTACRRCQ